MFQAVDDQVMKSFVAISFAKEGFMQGQKEIFQFHVSCCSLNDFNIKVSLRISSFCILFFLHFSPFLLILVFKASFNSCVKILIRCLKTRIMLKGNRVCRM